MNEQLWINHPFEESAVFICFACNDKRVILAFQLCEYNVFAGRLQVGSCAKHQFAIFILTHIKKIRRTRKAVVYQLMQVSISDEAQLCIAVTTDEILAFLRRCHCSGIEVGTHFHSVIGIEFHRKAVTAISVASSEAIMGYQF